MTDSSHVFYFSYYTLQSGMYISCMHAMSCIFHVEFLYAHLYCILSLVSIALILCSSCLYVIFFHPFNIVLVLKIFVLSSQHLDFLDTGYVECFFSPDGTPFPTFFMSYNMK